MTDPRMTPTNDAPVTVEQCDREAAAKLAEWLTAAQQEWEDMPLWFAFDAPASFRNGGFDTHEFVQSHARHRLAALASAPAEEHPDDVAVDRFAATMKTKLAVAREKGRGGWDDPAQCTVEHLRDLMHGHVAKGDPVDVANFCMMLFHRGGSTSAPAGDGVEALAQAAERAGCKEVPAAIRAGEPVLINTAIALDALARPRAAVGERDGAWAGVVATDPRQSPDDTDEDGNPCWYIEIQSIGGHSIVATIWGGSPEEVQARSDAILALQSPPANVER